MLRRAVSNFTLATFALWAAAGIVRADVPGISVRGTLTQSEDGKPALEISKGKLVLLEGDEPTNAVLKDDRLKHSDFEAIGHYEAPGRFRIDPINSRAMFVHKDGKRLMITYWCDVCYIRTYSPGPCWCCQKNTDLDLREPDHPESHPH